MKIIEMKELTKAQEEILIAVWTIGEGAVSDVLAVLPEPKPAYNTVATVIKVLEHKKYLTHKKYGKTLVYFPLVTKKEYARSVLKNTASGFFNGSMNKMVQFFVSDSDLSVNELEELKKILDKEIKANK